MTRTQKAGLVLFVVVGVILAVAVLFASFGGLRVMT